jgi:hypothetical protein
VTPRCSQPRCAAHWVPDERILCPNQCLQACKTVIHRIDHLHRFSLAVRPLVVILSKTQILLLSTWQRQVRVASKCPECPVIFYTYYIYYIILLLLSLKSMDSVDTVDRFRYLLENICFFGVQVGLWSSTMWTDRVPDTRSLIQLTKSFYDSIFDHNQLIS